MKAKLLLFLFSFFLGTAAFSQSARNIETIGFGEIIVIEMAPNGDTWVGSKGQGGAFYDATLQTWDYFNMANTPELKSDTITAITFSNIGGVQNAFVGTTNGAVSRTAGTWGVLSNLAGARITGLNYRPDSLWVLTPNSIVRYDSSKTFVQTYSSPLVSLSCAQKTSQSCKGFWAGSADNGCFVTKDGQTFTYIDTSAANRKIVDNRINVILADNNCSAKFVGTKGGFSVCPNGQPCQNFTTANGLPQNEITALALDCKGRVWLGTKDSGVAIFTNQAFTRVTTANGLASNKITALSFKDGCTGWIGSKDGNITEIDSNATVVKIVSGIRETNEQTLGVHIFPQPASNQINFVFEKEIQNTSLILNDISGRMIQQYSSGDVSHITADVSTLSEGIYFYQILSNKQTVKSGKVQILR